MPSYEERLLEALVESFRNSKKDSKTNVTARRTQLDPVKLYKDYRKNNADMEQIGALHDAVRQACSMGFLTCQMKGGLSSEIDKIYLIDEKVEEIERYLGDRYGYSSKAEKRKQVEQVLSAYEGRSPAADAECAKLRAALEKNRIPRDYLQTEQVLKALVFVENNRRPLYLREASMLIYGSSKYFEENTLETVCHLLRAANGRPCGEDEFPDEILEDYHIIKEKQKLRIKGPVTLWMREKVGSLCDSGSSGSKRFGDSGNSGSCGSKRFGSSGNSGSCGSKSFGGSDNSGSCGSKRFGDSGNSGSCGSNNPESDRKGNPGEKIPEKGTAVSSEKGQCAVIDLGCFRDGVEFYSDELERIEKVEIRAEELVTVENLSAYFRCSGGNKVFFYLGGYAARYQRDFLKKIYEENRDTSYSHFGDIDAGGFYILEHLRRVTGIPFAGRWMTQAELRDERFVSCLQSLTPNDRKRLTALAETSEFAETIAYMLKHNVKLEQEIVSLAMFGQGKSC